MATPGNESDPYGVPTGVVPRVPAPQFDDETDGVVLVDPIAQAVDDYLLMERKARAWDELRAMAGGEVLAMMDALVHPAQPSAPAKG